VALLLVQVSLDPLVLLWFVVALTDCLLPLHLQLFGLVMEVMVLCDNLLVLLPLVSLEWQVLVHRRCCLLLCSELRWFVVARC
jgi:hypothetical protein